MGGTSKGPIYKRDQGETAPKEETSRGRSALAFALLSPRDLRQPMSPLHRPSILPEPTSTRDTLT